MTIEACDNISLDSVEIYLNGEKTEYKAEDIENDTISMVIPESDKKQELRVICILLVIRLYVYEVADR